mmetsp:Transcript_15348/g.52066  ORF Transcript_15348/g.52066 Transcript_15348/m.52066 type:complete len:265 (+) Transcript_15348:1107-1901(+)
MPWNGRRPVAASASTVPRAYTSTAPSASRVAWGLTRCSSSGAQYSSVPPSSMAATSGDAAARALPKSPNLARCTPASSRITNTLPGLTSPCPMPPSCSSCSVVANSTHSGSVSCSTSRRGRSAPGWMTSARVQSASSSTMRSEVPSSARPCSRMTCAGQRSCSTACTRASRWISNLSLAVASVWKSLMATGMPMYVPSTTALEAPRPSTRDELSNSSCSTRTRGTGAAVWVRALCTASRRSWLARASRRSRRQALAASTVARNR